jgi:3-oxoacyl-[acyl-carrier protein] reductase
MTPDPPGRLRCVITGAAGGVGSALVKDRAARGDQVVEFVRPDGRARSQARDAVIECDLARSDAVDDAAEAVAARLDRLDLLVHAAGVANLAPLETVDGAAIQEQLSVNLGSVIHLTVALQPLLRRSPGALVVAFSSEQVRHPSPVNVAYGASKAGLEFAMKALAVSLADDRVRSNCVVLGGIDTPMLRRYVRPPAPPHNLTGRSGSTSEVVAAVDFLLGATFITGASLTIDGGASLT